MEKRVLTAAIRARTQEIDRPGAGLGGTSVVVPISNDRRDNKAAVAALFELITLAEFGVDWKGITHVFPGRQEMSHIDRAVSRGVETCFSPSALRADYEATRFVGSGPTLIEKVLTILNGALVRFMGKHCPPSWAVTSLINSCRKAGMDLVAAED